MFFNVSSWDDNQLLGRQFYGFEGGEDEMRISVLILISLAILFYLGLVLIGVGDLVSSMLIIVPMLTLWGLLVTRKKEASK